jgi:UTP-glucose-1-phosphate uridylyltransferase
MSASTKVRKAAIPAAGPGTRMLLPATKAIPKDTLPAAGKRKMRNLEIQIGNSSFIACGVFIGFCVAKTRALVRKYFRLGNIY